MSEVGSGSSGGGGESLSAEAELKDLRAKTNMWKQSVSVQLKEAAAKNQQLRDQLRQAAASHEDALANMRVQLDKEFRERTSLKDEELSSLQSQLSALRGDRLRVAAAHEDELQRLRAECAAALASAAAGESAAAPLREALTARDAQLLRAEHDAAVLTARLERLSAKYRELSGVLSHSGGTHGGDKEGRGGEEQEQEEEEKEKEEEVDPQQHAARLDAARAEFRGIEARHRDALFNATRGFDAERQRFTSELAARDAQLAAQETLLRQAQSEAALAHHKVAASRAEAHAAEERAAHKVATLAREAARRMEAEQRATAELERVKRAAARAETAIAELEADARQREDAFAALMLTEDSRALVRRLQEELAEALVEAEHWRAEATAAAAAARSHRREPEVQEAQWGIGAQGGGIGIKSALEDREAALAAETARLEARAQLLRATEERLEGLKRSIAAQAGAVLQQQSRADGAADHQRAAETAAAAVPKRYFQMMRDRGGGGHLRLRTVLPALLLALSLTMLVLAGRRATMVVDPQAREVTIR